MLLPTKKKIFFLCRRDKCNILLYIFSYNNNHIMKNFFRSFLLINQSFFLCVIFDSSTGFEILLVPQIAFFYLYFDLSNYIRFVFNIPIWLKNFWMFALFWTQVDSDFEWEIEFVWRSFCWMKKFGNERLNLRLKFPWNLFCERPY